MLKNRLKKKSSMPKSTTGLTLVEIIVVVAIGALLMAISTYSFSALRNNSSLQKNVVQVRAVFEEARALSISEKSDSTYGLQIQSDRVIMFKGLAYNSADSQNKILLLDTNALIDSISLNGGGSAVVLNRITGATNNYGTFRIRMTNGTNSSSTITIASTGIIN